MRVTSSFVISVVLRLPLLLLLLGLPLALGLLTLVEVLALLVGGCDAGVVGHLRAEARTAFRRMGLFAQAPVPARTAGAAAREAVPFRVRLPDIEVARHALAGDIDDATPLGFTSGAIALGTSSDKSPSAPLSSL